MSLDFTTHPSAEDRSVNFVADLGGGEALEARYVRRTDDAVLVYLSSHLGCDRACRFCHLTQTRQTSMAPASLLDYAAQARKVLEHAETFDNREPYPERIHFNFMARGEPLLNPTMTVAFGNLRGSLEGIARTRGFGEAQCRFNISTIMPQGAERLDLPHAFYRPYTGAGVAPTIFYSLYSLDPAFRRRWLPKAMDPYLALDKLQAWQKTTGGEVVLHHAFIAGQNDSKADTRMIIDAVRMYGLKARFNLVRYNPYSSLQGEESTPDVLEARLGQYAAGLDDPRCRMVPRVGFDVKASCGMFMDLAG